MPKITISDQVWNAIAERGRFGETEEDVLRRVFDLSPLPPERRISRSGPRGRGRTRHATIRMSARVESGQLIVDFESGARNSWPLPEKHDKAAIRHIRDDAVRFALDNEASDPGQTNAVRKALTDAGYYLSR